MPFTIVRQDITKMNVDAIVNAANTDLLMGGGVCGSIFKAAGAGDLQATCDKLAPIKTGEAVMTPGFKLPTKYIVHTAEPVYHGGKQGEAALLRSCYIRSLEVDEKHNCESIAFPLISSGIYGYPKQEALCVAVDAIRDFLDKREMDVFLAVFDQEALSISEKRLGEIQSYIDKHYVEERSVSRRKLFTVEEQALVGEMISSLMLPQAEMEQTVCLDDIIRNPDEPFFVTLLRLIDATGRKDAEIYRRANIDRRLFSKIRSNANYAPSKPTVLAFAIALELTLEQTVDLLERADFALSHGRKLDVIVECFIQYQSYDVFEINEALFQFDQPLLVG